MHSGYCNEAAWRVEGQRAGSQRKEKDDDCLLS
jgi:hypothetical protein